MATSDNGDPLMCPLTYAHPANTPPTSKGQFEKKPEMDDLGGLEVMLGGWSGER